VYWVLDGVLSCACVREHVRVCVRAMRVCVQCACAFLCVLICVVAHLCACARVRACMRASVVRVARAFPWDCIFSLVSVANACVCLAAACALPSHSGDMRYQ
jgi:hypothetical protein